MIDQVLRGEVPIYTSDPDGHRLYMKAYMALYRSGRRLRGRRPLQRRFNRPGYCVSCGHIWPLSDRCPMCAAEPQTAALLTRFERALRLRAWMELVEVALVTPEPSREGLN